MSAQVGATLGKKPLLNARGYVFDEIAELNKRWANRLSYNDLSIAESYVDLRLNLVVDCSARVGDGHAKEFRAVFKGLEAILGGDPDIGKFHCFACFGMGNNGLECDAATCGPNGENEAMSIPNAEPVQSPKFIVPTLVGLQCFDEGDGFGGEFLYRLFRSGFEFLGVPRDWERDIVYVDGGVSLDGKAARGMIEGRPQVLDGVAYNGGKFLRDGLEDAQLIDQLFGLKVCLGESFVGVGLPIGLISSVNLLDVGFGPFNL
jgi:hypothetical protein